MRGIVFFAVLLLESVNFSYSMSVTDWGITNDIPRVRFVLRDLFQQSFKLVADDFYSLPDFKQSYGHTYKNKTALAQFRAYNGRLSNVKIDVTDERGSLRRLPIVNKPGSRHHELIACGDCLTIESSGLNYLYEAYFDKSESHGRLYNGPIVFTSNFEMNIIHNENQTDNIPICKMYFQPFTLMLKENGELVSPRIENVGVLNFLADKLDTWLIQHLNVTVSNNLLNSLANAITIVSKNHNICDEFLSV